MLHTDSISTTDVRALSPQPLYARPPRCTRWLLPATIAAVAGCSDEPVSLGGAVAIDRSALSSYAAVWEGYVEAYTFASGSDRVRLVLDENGEGTLTLGEAVPRPLPTDADDPFPDLQSPQINTLLQDQFHEGFEHPLASALVEEERLRTRTEPTNVYGEAACALQTVANPTCGQDNCVYMCVPNLPGGYVYRDDRCFVAADDTEVSCKKLEFCQSVCECTSTECFARSPGAALVLDGALDEAGTKLVGSLGERTIRLTRQP